MGPSEQDTVTKDGRRGGQVAVGLDRRRERAEQGRNRWRLKGGKGRGR